MLKRVLYTMHIFERDGIKRKRFLPVGDVVFNTERHSEIIAEVKIAGLKDSGPLFILRGRPQDPPSEEVMR